MLYAWLDAADNAANGNTEAHEFRKALASAGILGHQHACISVNYFASRGIKVVPLDVGGTVQMAQ